MSPRPRLSQEEIEEHAALLVEATFRVAAATGNSTPSVREILNESGLSRQAFYRCFGSSDELMTAVLTEGRRILADYLAGRMARERTPEGKVRAWVAGVMRQAQTAPERTRPFMMTPVAPSEYVADTDRFLSSMLAEAIAAGVEEGAWESTDPMGDALIIHDFVFDSLRRHLFRDERPARETIQRLGDFAVRGLAVGERAVERVDS
jgi:AcrR family transcriptional regulator